jgi:hypothetical protein
MDDARCRIGLDQLVYQLNEQGTRLALALDPVQVPLARIQAPAEVPLTFFPGSGAAESRTVI